MHPAMVWEIKFYADCTWRRYRVHRSIYTYLCTPKLLVGSEAAATAGLKRSRLRPKYGGRPWLHRSIGCSTLRHKPPLFFFPEKKNKTSHGFWLSFGARLFSCRRKGPTNRRQPAPPTAISSQSRDTRDPPGNL